MRRNVLLLCLALAASPSFAADRPSAKLAAYIRDQLHASRYSFASVDLNGDGRPEALIYENGPGDCGSGGCDLVVLTPRGSGFAEVMDASVTRPPIRLLPTSSHGWRDIGVFVSGGGIRPGYDVRLRFDGHRYPGNPTVSPAERLRGARGRVLIAR